MELDDAVSAQAKRIREDWTRTLRDNLTPAQPFSAHQEAADKHARQWPSEVLGPFPLWFPSSKEAGCTNVARFLNTHGHLLQLSTPHIDWERRRIALEALSDTSSFILDWERLQLVSVWHPTSFWSSWLKAMGFPFPHQIERILACPPRGSNPDECQWLPGARMNVAEVALNQFARCTDLPAIVASSELNPSRLETWSHAELQSTAWRIAAALRAAGQGPGARVAIIMSMTPLAVAIYLGVVLAGGAVVSVPESFSSDEMQLRFDIADTSLIFVKDKLTRAGRTIDLYGRVTAIRRRAPAVLLTGDTPNVRPKDGDCSWHAFLGSANVSSCPVHRADSAEITNILFSSGTTGTPKAIPWTHITPFRPVINAWACQDLRGGDVMAWPSSLGWVMGPWLVYACLMNGATMALFDGAPTQAPFGRFLRCARVTVLGLIPSFVKAWRSSGCMDGVDLTGIKCFSSTGEASSPEDYHWLMARAGYRPILEYCGGTEIGGAFCCSTLLHPCIPSTFATCTLGTDVAVLSTTASRAASISLRVPLRGEIAVRAPSIGLSQALLNKDHFAVYYEGMPLSASAVLRGSERLVLPLRRHGDEMEVLPGCGYIRALGRCDDTMNLGGIKVSSVEIERACAAKVPGVNDVAAVAVPRAQGGPERLVLVCTLSPTAHQRAPSELRESCQTALRSLNPLFKVHRVIVAQTLPRNASNKVMRRLLREQLLSEQAQARSSL